MFSFSNPINFLPLGGKLRVFFTPPKDGRKKSTKNQRTTFITSNEK